jgi:sulfur carrier protein ThiS
MIVSVWVQGHLKHFRPDRQDRFAVKLPDGATVRALLDESGIPWAEVGVVAVNGLQAGDDTVLQDGDQVVLIAPMEGG